MLVTNIFYYSHVFSIPYKTEIKTLAFFVAYVEDKATMSSIWYFENYVSYFVQNQRK